METFLKAIGLGTLVIIGIIVLAFLLSLPTMWTWNYVMPYLFGFKTIDWTQALALNILSSIVLGRINNNTIKSN